MPSASRITLIGGLLTLGLTIFNWFTAEQISPSIERAELLSGMAAVGLMLVAIIWSEVNPAKAKKVNLKGVVRIHPKELTKILEGKDG